jgi:hypothetical protein
MNTAITIIGIALLALLAGAIGLGLRGEQVGRQRAWRDIAAARRRNWEERQQLDGLLQTLEHRRGCPYCTRAADDPPD